MLDPVNPSWTHDNYVNPGSAVDLSLSLIQGESHNDWIPGNATALDKLRLREATLVKGGEPAEADSSLDLSLQEFVMFVFVSPALPKYLYQVWQRLTKS